MSVRIILDIPDEIAAQLAAGGQALPRSALEALALESYRVGALTQVQVGRLLGLSRIETEDFLAEHLDLYDYEPNELRRESDALSRLPIIDRGSLRLVHDGCLQYLTITLPDRNRSSRPTSTTFSVT
jgi:hypothetical protein